MLDSNHIHPVDEFFGQIGEVEAAQTILVSTQKQQTATSPLELRNSVFNDELCESLSHALSVVAGTTLTDFSSQKEMAEAISDLTNGGRWQLTFEGTPVRMRAINPKRSQSGYFQLRALGSEQASVYTGKTLPRLNLSKP